MPLFSSSRSDDLSEAQGVHPLGCLPPWGREGGPLINSILKDFGLGEEFYRIEKNANPKKSETQDPAGRFQYVRPTSVAFPGFPQTMQAPSVEET